MKKRIVTFATVILALVATNTLTAQKFDGLDKSPMDVASYPSAHKISNKFVKIAYSRPQLKGRDLATLVPQDKVWRTGANEAAEITFYKDVTFGDKKVKAGSYTLFTIPGESEWTVILSTAKNVWGAYFYNESEDVVRVKASVSKSENEIEAFSIVFEGEENNINMHLGWGNTIVSLPIKG